MPFLDKKKKNAATQRWHKKNPEYKSNWRKEKIKQDAEYKRRIKLKNRYGISLEEFTHLKALQNNKCAICQNEFTNTPHIDHDHLTQKVRGLLCRSCNTSIGNLKDSPFLLNRAIIYLIRSGSH